MQAVNAAVSNELAARIGKGTLYGAALAGLKKRDRAWGRRQVCACTAPNVPVSSGAQSASGDFPDFFNKDDNPYARSGSRRPALQRDWCASMTSCICGYVVIRSGAGELTVLTSEPLRQENLVADIAATWERSRSMRAGILSMTPPNKMGRQRAATNTNSGRPNAHASTKAGPDEGGIVLAREQIRY